MTPLQVFEAIWAEKIGAALPLVPTVNYGVNTDELPDKWAAVVYQPETRADVTLGSNPWVEESGVMLVGLFARSGSGADVLDSDVDLVRNTFHGAARDNLVVFQLDGPHDIEPEADGEWWRLALSARYTFQTVRNQVGPLYHGWQGFDER